jgi:hypothetical protein
MKKFLLALTLTLSFSAVMAKSEVNNNLNSAQNVFLLQKAPANSGIQQKLNGTKFDQCTISCLNKFRSCIATAQGTGAWWWCEMAFERCEAKCFNL